MILLLACTFDNDRTTGPELEVKEYIQDELSGLADAAVDLQSAAPDTWGDTSDMEKSWYQVRDHYEHIEAAIAVLFPDLDVSTDQRYDYFITTGPDENPFDGEGVVGNHAIERILWADRMPEPVLRFESALPYYSPAASPANAEETAAFREELCGRFVDDTRDMSEQFAPLTLDTAAAFRGVISSMAEQYEKTNLAATGEDESRYSQHTLGDMRANLAGGQRIFEAFKPELEDEALASEIEGGFARVSGAYDAISGNAIPQIPDTWNPDAPTEADLQTPYGQLWSVISVEADPTIPGSLVTNLETAAEKLGIPQQ